jgi:NADH-quinone oxidoreductase subunit B
LKAYSRRASSPTSLDSVINWARNGSMWPMTFGLACCAVEMMHAGAARYDLDRFGIVFPAEPPPVRRDDRRRNALQQDGAGAAQGLRPDGRAALGDLDGLVRERRRLLPLFVFRRARAATASSPVDIYVPGCPPTSEALLYGILQLQNKIWRTNTIAR